MQNSEKKSIQKLNIKIHSTSENIKEQLKLKSKLESIMENYSNRFSNSIKYKLAIVIGLTSAVVEILEHDVKVLHICTEPLFECYTELFWPSIRVNQVNEYVYFYKIVKKGNALKFGYKSNLFKKYC